MGRGATQRSDAKKNLALVSEPFGALLLYLEYLKRKNTNLIKIKP
jgi:hypothetical protein